jgi:hypothetical protein
MHANVYLCSYGCIYLHIYTRHKYKYTYIYRCITDLPFLPGLEILSIAYNSIVSLDGLEENTPNLLKLDVSVYKCINKICVYVCIYMCICMYIHIYLYIYTYIYINMYMKVVRICSNLNICIM